MTASTSFRLAIAVAVGTALMLVLGIGALGVIGDGGRADRGYLAVLVVLAVGTALARLRPRGMALALLATALTQVIVPVVVLATDVPGTEDVSVLDVVGLTVMFAGLFGVSALLFHRAAGQQAKVAVDSHS
jgi:hypothetical protein